MSQQWTDELKQQVIEEYTSKNPTPETTGDIIEVIAEEHGKTVNGVRMILSKASVYVSKGKPSSSSPAEDKPARKTKQESLDELSQLLEDHEVQPDDTVISKMTGKAAEFFIKAINQIIED